MDRKLPREMENPIDNVIIDVGRRSFPLFKKLHFTPNTLTTCSLIFGLLSAFLYYHKYFISSAITYLLSYAFDAFDGNYAREYNMVTKFGDYYDHIKDLFINILLLLVFVKTNNFSKKTLIIIFIITTTLSITLSAHLNCQEHWVKKNDPKNISPYLTNATKMIFLGSCTKYIHILKYFGCGTFALWITLVMIASKYITT